MTPNVCHFLLSSSEGKYGLRGGRGSRIVFWSLRKVDDYTGLRCNPKARTAILSDVLPKLTRKLRITSPALGSTDVAALSTQIGPGLVWSVPSSRSTAAVWGGV